MEPSFAPALHLNALLRCEIAGTIAYRTIIATFPHEPLPELRLCRQSHLVRANHLRRRIQRLGGTPAMGPGRWCVFSDFCSDDLGNDGLEDVLNRLSDSERWMVDDYWQQLVLVDPVSRDLLVEHHIPEQERTHELIRHLQGALGLVP
jgi:bacterioferritin (cytochrome b1)